MSKVHLVLARGPGKPDGDVEDRLDLDLKLNGQGHIDLSAFEARPEPWAATRAQAGRGAKPLEVARSDELWILQSTGSQDDPIWVFEGQVYRPGELVVLRPPEGEELLFRIVATE